MYFDFDLSLAQSYKSSTQKIRIMSESWAKDNMFCPCCGNPYIKKLDNNIPVGDFKCDNCSSVFELKSKKGKLGKK